MWLKKNRSWKVLISAAFYILTRTIAGFFKANEWSVQLSSYILCWYAEHYNSLSSNELKYVHIKTLA